MPDTPNSPSALLAQGALPDAQGLIDGEWYYEEHHKSIRLGMHLREKLHEEQTEFQKLAIYDTSFFGRLLVLDDCVMLTERDEFIYHEMLAHVALCSLPEPKTALIIGGGDCGCLREILKHPTIERVVQCDIDEGVTRVCSKFFKWLKPSMADKRAEVIFEDGVAYIERNTDEFDLIIIDSTDPTGPGVGLFLKDFYNKVSKALKPGGVMVAQTESPHWDANMLGAIYEEIRATFALVSTFMGAIPTYPSGLWTWAYASDTRSHYTYFDNLRANQIEQSCLYYNSQIHEAAFCLPGFVQKAVSGENVFERFDSKLPRKAEK